MDEQVDEIKWLSVKRQVDEKMIGMADKINHWVVGARVWDAWVGRQVPGRKQAKLHE